MTPRTNPFRAERLDNLPYFFEDGKNSETAWESLWLQLENYHYRAAIIGAHGRGKSTLLDSFAAQLQSRGWHVRRLKLNDLQRNFDREIWRDLLPTLEARDFILLDGAEQLSFWRWKLFLQHTKTAGGILITSHRSGLLPTLFECRSSPQLLHSLIIYLDCKMQETNEDQARALFEKHRGNMRDALRELYDLQSTTCFNQQLEPP